LTYEKEVIAMRSHATCKYLYIGIMFCMIIIFNVTPIFAAGVALSWDPPTTNTDGTPLTDIAGYKVYYGTASGNYSLSIDVGNVTTYQVNNLTSGFTYYFVTTVYNTSGNESGYSNEINHTIQTSDTTPPVVSGIQSANVTSSSVTVSWTTNEASDTQIEYGTSISYGNTTVLNSSMVTSHSQNISGLSSSTLYHYRVRSRDASANLAVSGDYPFTTAAPQAPTDYYCDSDNDGYIDISTDGSCSGSNCEPAGCQTTPGNDCNDGNSNINPAASDANCNGIDDNCDGSIDEDYAPTSTTCGIGECASTGQTTCVDGIEGDTCTPGTPVAETCDGLDNDCDSSIDEDFTDLGTTCTVGAGACEATGTYICTADGSGTECDTMPGTPGLEGPDGDATCTDTIDNDCDGTTDAGDADCACAPTGLSDNNCDGIDDDCDGTADNSYVSTDTTCGLGVCGSTGQLICSNGSVVDTCSAGSPSGDDSDCNGIDDNCDGTPDNNYIVSVTSCGSGVCSSTGQLECQNGTEVNTCLPGTPSEVTESTCDGLDNDCDGLTDEECSPAIEVSRVLINEDFPAGMPDSWSAQGSWNADNTCGKSIDYPFVEPYAIVDSSCMNTDVDELITETFDTTSCSNIELAFSNQYYWYAGNVEVETSSDGGTTWTTAALLNGDDGYPVSNWKDMDISTVSDAEQALIKFKYSNNNTDGFWALDNVWVTCQSSQLEFSGHTQETSAPQTIMIANSGSEYLTVNTITIGGTNASDFSISGSANCANQILQPAESCTFDVVFSPTFAGGKNAALSISSTDPNSTLSTISLAGSAYEPAIVSPLPLVKVNNSLSRNVSLNKGNNVRVTIELDPGSLNGQNADWWVLMEKRNRTYYKRASNGKWRRGLSFYQQSPINKLTPVQVLNTSRLRPGQYRFHFGIDTSMNGIKDSNEYYDEVIVNIK
jgi:hypothetical protein